MRKRIVIVGSNFAGYAAARHLAAQLGSTHEIVVIAASDEFCFAPALLWVPFGLRDERAVFRPLRPLLDRIGVKFKHATATQVDPAASVVHTQSGIEAFDYLILATGDTPHVDERTLTPSAGHIQSLATWDDANSTRAAVERYVERGGNAAVAVLPNSSQYLLAYEFAFALAHELLRRGRLRQSSITIVTPEPFAGHCGGSSHSRTSIEKLLRDWNIDVRTSALVAQATPDALVLRDGDTVPYSLALAFPASVGVDAVKRCSTIVDRDGFVRVNASMQSHAFPNVFAAGSAVAVTAFNESSPHCGAPKSGYFAEQSGRMAAFNVTALLRNEALLSVPMHAIDAQGVLLAAQDAERMGGDQSEGLNRFDWQIPGPEQRWARLALEQHYPVTSRPRSSAA